MNSSMIYCQCNFCKRLPRQTSAINSLATPLQLSTTFKPPLCANSCTNAAIVTTTPDEARGAPRLNISRKPQHPGQQEQLKFGIEKILYGSFKSDLFGTHLNVTYTTPHSTTRQTHSPSWSRPVFSDHQRKTLENRFQLQHYLNKRERYQLSLYLGLTEHQIKVWFQNRRVKWRHAQEVKQEQKSKLPRAVKSAGKE